MGDITTEELELLGHQIIEEFFKQVPDDYGHNYVGDQTKIAMTMANIGCAFLAHPTLGPIFKIVLRKEMMGMLSSMVTEESKERAVKTAEEIVRTSDEALCGMQMHYIARGMAGGDDE